MDTGQGQNQKKMNSPVYWTLCLRLVEGGGGLHGDDEGAQAQGEGRKLIKGKTPLFLSF